MDGNSGTYEIHETKEEEEWGEEVVLESRELDPTGLFIEEIQVRRLGGGNNAN